MSYELLAHTADLRARLAAPDVVGLYASAVDLIRDVLVAGGTVAADESRVLDVGSCPDEGERLFRFVRELLYLFDVEAFVPARLDSVASLTVSGERFDPARHEAGHLVKAVTRHHLSFHGGSHGFEAEMVLDL